MAKTDEHAGDGWPRPAPGDWGPYREPCVKVTKLRECGPEIWDDWCCRHHHWLNGEPAIPVEEAERIERARWRAALA
jgi:hypothetical protein